MRLLLPADDRRQRVRLQRYFMAVGSYAMWLGLAGLGYAAGLVRLSGLAIALALCGVLATNLTFYLLLRSGQNLRFADPALTLAQCLVGIFWGSVLIAAAVDARGLMMLSYVIVLLFGMFRLDVRGYAIVAGFAAVSYTGVVALEWLHFGMTLHPRAELMHGAALGGLLAWSALFALHAGRLKARLGDKNRQLQRMVEHVRLQAERDELTRVYSRRYLMESLQTEKTRADRSGTLFSICIFDLDHFKSVNDRYGHLCGDRALAAFADRARGELRRLDQLDLRENGAFGRYGGEEFLLLLPHTRLGGAVRCAERLRSVTAAEPFENGLRLTLSAGVAEYRGGESIEETLRRADEALYIAKQGGRNRVASEAGDPDGSGPWRIAAHG